MAETDNLVGELIGEVTPGGKLFTKVAPGLIAKGYYRLFGPTLYFYGQPRSGKTSFIRYAITREPINPDEETEVTELIKIDHNWLAFGLPAPSEAIVNFSAIRDRVGQSDGEEHARLLIKEKPNSAVIMLDSSQNFSGQSPFAIEKYLSTLFSSIERFGPKVPSKVSRLWFVINKVDLKNGARATTLENRVRKLVMERSRSLIHPARVKIRTCSLVDGDNFELLRERLFKEILADLVFK